MKTVWPPEFTSPSRCLPEYVLNISHIWFDRWETSSSPQEKLLMSGSRCAATHSTTRAPPRLLQLLSLSLSHTANHTGSAIPMRLFAEAVSLSVISQVPLSTGSVLLVLFINIVIYLFFLMYCHPDEPFFTPSSRFLFWCLLLPSLCVTFCTLCVIISCPVSTHRPSFPKVKGNSMDSWDRKGLILNLCPQICQQSWCLDGPLETVASPLAKIRQRFILTVCSTERNWNLPLPNLFPAPPRGNVTTI